VLGSGSFLSSDSMFFHVFSLFQFLKVDSGVCDCVKNCWCEIDSVKKCGKGSVGMA